MQCPAVILAIGLGSILPAQEPTPTLPDLQKSAAQAFNQSRYREAEKLAGQGLKAHANDARLLSIRAWSLLRLADADPKRLADAGAAFDLAWQKRDPNRVDLRLGLGLAITCKYRALVKGISEKRRTALFSRAEELLSSLLSHDSCRLDALDHLFSIQAQTMRRKESLETGRLAIETAMRLRQDLEKVVQTTRFKERAKIAEKEVLALCSRTFRLRERMRTQLLQSNEHQRRIGMLMTESIDAAERSPRAFYYRGISRRARGARAPAARDFGRFIEISLDRDPALQRDAIEQMRALGPASKVAVDALLMVAARKTSSIELRCEAITTLAILGSSANKALPVLRRLATHSDKRLAAIARSAAVQIVKQPR